MSRWNSTLCVVTGLLLLVLGWLVPAHLRAVDPRVLACAGRNTRSVAACGEALAARGNLGAAELLLPTATTEPSAEAESLRRAVASLSQHPVWQGWAGGEPRLEARFVETNQAEPALSVTTWMVRERNRGQVLELLRASSSPAVQALLRCRELTNTVLFPPSGSAAGQAFDTAVALGGLLVDQGRLTPGLSNAVFKLAAQAGYEPQPFERMLMELLSLGQRFNESQLAEFLAPVPDPATLQLMAEAVLRTEGEAAETNSAASLPGRARLFAAVVLSGQPAAVMRYLTNFAQTGPADLATALTFGAGGLDELLRHQERLWRPPAVALQQPAAGLARWVAPIVWRAPAFALALKWLLYFGSGFLLAAALHYGRKPVPALERPIQVGGLHWARESLFALGFLLVVLLLSEPFLAQNGQKAELTFRLRLPMAGGVVPAATPNARVSPMNETILLTLLLFFVLQGLLYTACLVKLAEIRRQRVPARVRLKLLENEDHLFDAGLYLGFVGTIISLILFSIGVTKPSLMAAYSSTSFGIIFVSAFKIFHLRPTRRRLLLEAEMAPQEAQSPSEPALLPTS